MASAQAEHGAPPHHPPPSSLALQAFGQAQGPSGKKALAMRTTLFFPLQLFSGRKREE